MISTLEAQRPAMIREALEHESRNAEPCGWTDAVLVAWGPEGTRLAHTAAKVDRRGTHESRWATVWLLLRAAMKVLFRRSSQ